MNINSQNYEAYLLDMIEGRLTADEKRLLKAFIDSHPECGLWEDDEEQLPVLQAKPMTMPGKDRLKVDEPAETAGIDAASFDQYAIAFHEGLLGKADQLALKQFIALNPAYAATFAQYGKVYLKPDTSIIFPDKEALIQHRTVAPFAVFARNLSIAASIILLFGAGLWWLLQNPSVERTSGLPQLASLKPATIQSSSVEPEMSVKIRPMRMAVSSAIPEETILSNERLAPVEMLALSPTTRIDWTPAIGLLYDESRQSMYYFYDGAAVLAALEAETAEPKRSALGRVFANLASKAQNRIQPLQTDEANQLAEEPPLQSGISLWKVAKASVNTYNALTDNQVELKKITDQSGKLKAVQFDSQSINLTRTIKGRKSLSASEN